MNFRTWTRALHVRGCQVLAPSHPVPIELWAALPGGADTGGVVHFRCRGTSATLAWYAGADLAIVAPADPCACDCARQAALESSAQRVLVRPGASPLRTARWDGRHERGWTGYEAGLLGVAAAAELFDQLLARVISPPPPCPARSAPTRSAPTQSTPHSQPRTVSPAPVR